jgi:hypothetical protein
MNSDWIGRVEVVTQSKRIVKRVENFGSSVTRQYGALGWLFLLLLLLQFGLFLAHSLAVLGHQGEAMYGEGILLNQVRLLSQGIPIYKAADQYPYTVAIYTPTYYLLMAALTKVIGLSLVAGRLVSLCAAFSIGCMIYAIVHKSSGRSFLALCAALIFFSFPPVRHWAALFRPDVLATALSLAGIFLLSRQPKRLYLAGSLFVVAFLTKQSYLAGPLAAILFVLSDDWRAGLKLAAWTMTLAAVSLVGFQILTDGWFLFDIVVLNANPVRLNRVLAGLLAIFIFQIPYFGVIMGYFRPGWSRAERLFLCYLLATLLHILAISKRGSAPNYFLEPQAALSIVSGLALNWLIFEKRLPSLHRGLWNRLAFAGLVYLSVVAIFSCGDVLSIADTTSRTSVPRRVAKVIENVPGPVLSDDTVVVVKAGKPVVFEPYLFSLLAEEGKWDPELLITRIRGQEFDLLILRRRLSQPPPLYQDGEFWHRDIWDSMRSNYRMAYQVGSFYIYEPLQVD